MAETKVPDYLPAKSLKDIELDENLYEADFEASARYDELAKELERLALLGIGAYGFFIAKSGIDGSALTAGVHLGFGIVGLLAFAVCAGCALVCSHWDSRCLRLQVDILRLLGRMESGRWEAPAEREVNAYYLNSKRADQLWMLQKGHTLIFSAVIALIVGATATAFCFILALAQHAYRN